MNATQKQIWVTKDGRKIPVKEMTRTHLINAYLMCRRNGYVSPATLAFYLTCREPDGEGAQDAFWKEFDSVCDSEVLVSMGWLEDELECRGINRHEL